MENPVGNYNILTSSQTTADRYSKPVKMPHCRTKTMQAMAGTGSSTGAATVKFWGSCKTSPVAMTSTATAGDWTQIGSTLSLTPDKSSSDWVSGAVTSTDGFLWFMVTITSISGSGINTAAWIAG